MTDSDESFNPFQAPESPVDPGVLRLRDDDEYLVSSKVILCREEVNLPKVCIHSGEEGVFARTKTLRILANGSVAKIVIAAVVVISLPVYRSFSTARFFQSSLVSVIMLITLPTFFIAVLWWSIRNGMYSVKATWFISERQQRQMKLVTWIVRGTLVVLPVVLLFETGLHVVTSAVLLFVVIGLSFNPETGLKLTGRKNDAFVLQGHSKKFHRAVLEQQNSPWTAAAQNPAQGDVTEKRG